MFQSRAFRRLGLGLVVLGAACVSACSDDNQGTGETPDTGTEETSTLDSGDTGTDSGVDSGVDSTVDSDTGVDSTTDSTADTTDSTTDTADSTTVDSTTDSADSAADSASDTADTATDTADGAADTADSSADADAGPPKVCSTDKWCLYGTATSSSLFAIWGFGATNVWAAGFGGTITRLVGTSWLGVTSPTTQQINSIWGANPDDVWLVGNNGTVVHWTGGTYVVVPSGTTATLFKVRGSSASDVWIVGTGGVALRWNGSTLSTVSTGTTTALTVVEPFTTTNAVLGGASGLAKKFDGTAFTDLTPSPPSTAVFTSSRPLSSTNIWFSLLSGGFINWTTTAWTTYPLPTGAVSTRVNDLWAFSNTNVVGVGPSGMVVRGGTGGFTVESTPTTNGLNGIWANTSTDIWIAVNGGAVLHYEP